MTLLTLFNPSLTVAFLFTVFFCNYSRHISYQVCTCWYSMNKYLCAQCCVTSCIDVTNATPDASTWMSYTTVCTVFSISYQSFQLWLLQTDYWYFIHYYSSINQQSINHSNSIQVAIQPPVSIPGTVSR